MPQPTSLTCTLCSATAHIPQNRDHRPLWAAGWRWIGSQNLYSCPACPQMVVVAENGTHYRGPGVEAAAVK